MPYDASNIKVLDGLEHVRTRPAMYIGSTNVRGLNHLVYEIVDNAVDEYAQGYGNTIEVTLSKEGECLVIDHGRGIPVDVHPQTGVSALRTVLTTLNAGGKFDNNSYKYSSGLHGVGSSVVNALSEYFMVSVLKDGKVYTDTYKRGVPTTQLLSDGSLPCLETDRTGSGTSICFKPDPDVFSTVEFRASDIKERLHETAYLNPSLTIKFVDERTDPVDKVTYHEPNGIVQYLKDMTSSETSVCEPCEFSNTVEGDEGPVEVSIAFVYVQSTQERIVGFCNNVQTSEGGTHVTALKSTLTSLVNQYARQLGVLKEKDANFAGPDVRSGLCAVVSVKHTNPQFEGQTKTKLGNSDVLRVVSSVCFHNLQLYFDRHVDVLKDVLSIAEKSSKLRKSEAKARKGLFAPQKKYSFDSNGKLASCESKEYNRNELLICEGDSAAGSAKMARDRKHQAILPIRGKILNVEKASLDSVLANKEIQTIIHTLGCGFSEGYGQDFDVSKLKYDKIILLTDRDLDGAHIVTLLVTLFYRLMPEVVLQGHLYVANPPLYKVIPKRGKETYLQTDKELEQYRKTHKDFRLQRYKGLGEMNPEQLWETTMNPETRVLSRVCVGNDAQASKLTSVLMGTDVTSRREYIESHGKEANIDV